MLASNFCNHKSTTKRSAGTRSGKRQCFRSVESNAEAEQLPGIVNSRLSPEDCLPIVVCQWCVCLQAVSLLFNICLGQTGRPPVKEAGGIAVLCGILPLRPNNPDIIPCACGALANLSVDGEHKKEVQSHGERALLSQMFLPGADCLDCLRPAVVLFEEQYLS